jgi:hypothetical protein
MTAPRMRSARSSALALAALSVFAALCPAPAFAIDPLDVLIAHYPEALAGRAGNVLLFKDGTRLDAGTADPAAPFDRLLRHASIRDQFRIPYPLGPLSAPPNSDPGRFRNQALFEKLYGHCRKGEIDKTLVPVIWLPHSWNRPVTFTRRNGAADALAQVSAEIDRLPPALKRAAYPTNGTYVCRTVADAGQPSLHAFAAAIDLNLAYSDYWLWRNGKDLPPDTVPSFYRSRMSQAIVDAFERHGFIWGGKWYHYDTMHFEYRPELTDPRLAQAAYKR